MKCLLGKLRTRVSVFSEAGKVGGQAIETLVETWADCMVANLGSTTESEESMVGLSYKKRVCES